MLNDNVLDRMRVAGKLLALTEHFGAARLEAACARALHFDDPAYWTIKRILTRNLDAAPTPSPSPTPDAETFVRSAEELVGRLFDDLEGVTWN
jgi:hypothetical protein